MAMLTRLKVFGQLFTCFGGVGRSKSSSLDGSELLVRLEGTQLAEHGTVA